MGPVRPQSTDTVHCFMPAVVFFLFLFLFFFLFFKAAHQILGWKEIKPPNQTDCTERMTCEMSSLFSLLPLSVFTAQTARPQLRASLALFQRTRLGSDGWDIYIYIYGLVFFGGGEWPPMKKKKSKHSQILVLSSCQSKQRPGTTWGRWPQKLRIAPQKGAI